MKKLFGLSLIIGVVLGLNAVIFAQTEGNMPPPQGGQGKMRRGGQDGPGRPDGPGGRGMRGGKRDGMREGRGGGPGEMRGGGFGISDDEIFQLNLTNDQKVKLFDFRKKLFTEREAMRKSHQPGEGMMKPGDGMKPGEGMNPDEMRQLMSAKNLGTLTAEQKAKLDAMETKRKEMMTKRQTEMEAMKTKMEATHQEFLNIFTLDQRKQLEAIRAEKGKKMQEMRQNRPNRQGRPTQPNQPNQPKKPE